MRKRALPDLIKEHHQLAARVIELEAEIAHKRSAALATLPAAYGYADLASFIRAVRSACQPPKRTKARRAPGATSKRVSAAVAPQTTAIPASGVAINQPTVAALKPTESSRLTGTSLDNPKHFGLLPDATVLDPAGLASHVHQARLSDALKFTQQVLHTSGVPAVIWREWRQFERKASEILRALHTVTRPDEL